MFLDTLSCFIFFGFGCRRASRNGVKKISDGAFFFINLRCHEKYLQFPYCRNLANSLKSRENKISPSERI